MEDRRKGDVCLLLNVLLRHTGAVGIVQKLDIIEVLVRRTLCSFAFVTGLLIACFPTEPCACPPTTSLFLIFGKVLRGDGEPASRAVVSAVAAHDDKCVFDNAEPLGVSPILSDELGGVRSYLRSSYGGTGSRCLRLVAYGGGLEARDSVVLPDLIVQFRMDRETPDSLGVIFQLP